MNNNHTRVIVADDTDVFVLLVHFKHAGFLGNGPIYMELVWQPKLIFRLNVDLADIVFFSLGSGAEDAP